MVTLFDYQQKAFNLLIEAFKARAVALVVMATGLGKTIVAAFWAKSELKKKYRGLFLCHENGILEQAMGEFRKVIGDAAVFAPFFGADGNKDFNADKADMVFASFQSYVDWKIVFPEDWFDFIIVDESHHGQAPTFKGVIQYFKPKKLLGITATPNREDMKNIREIFGEEVVNYPLEEAIAKNWLTQVEYHILNDNLNHWKLKKIIRGVLEEGQRVSIKQINETIFIKKRDEEIARTIQKYAGSSKKAIIFCEKIEHAENFQSHLPDSLTYHSKVKGGRKENRKRLDAFREGSLQYILAVNKFNEGIDVPDAELIVFLRCTDSKTIFFQQLGRGLRKIFGKEKVVVLDFVANCERLAIVKEMAHRVKEFAGNNFMLNKELLHVSGAAFDFVFSDEQVEILDLVKRINEPFYETWQKASEGAIALEVKNQRDYYKKYKPDSKLPAHPHHMYKDFPGWTVFLGGEEKNFYPTWQDASKAAIALGIKDGRVYIKKYKSDLKLPASPSVFYEDFPGWNVFFEREERIFYPTWQDASKAAIALGVGSQADYKKRRKSDSKFPASPDGFYKDFPGWTIFLGGEEKIFYPTWQDASKAAIALGVKSVQDYYKKYKKDLRLPSNPNHVYKNFPSWYEFLRGKKRKCYSSWKKASNAVRSLNIKTMRGYMKRHSEDCMLPGDLRFYANFPGWRIFIGKGNIYKSWQKASNAAMKLGLSDAKEYKKNYSRDPRLPSNPNVTYKDFPGWKKFLGKK